MKLWTYIFGKQLNPTSTVFRWKLQYSYFGIFALEHVIFTFNMILILIQTQPGSQLIWASGWYFMLFHQEGWASLLCDARYTSIIVCAFSNFFNSLNVPGVFFLLKLVAMLLFLLRLHCFFFAFSLCCWFVLVFHCWESCCLGWGESVMGQWWLLLSSSSTFKVHHFVAFYWVCVSWSVCVSYKYRSKWFVRSIRINLIRKLKLHIRIKLIHMTHMY